MELLKRFYYEEDGMGTIELVMIIAALMCIALLFRKQIMAFVSDIIAKVFNTDLIKDPSDKG